MRMPLLARLVLPLLFASGCATTRPIATCGSLSPDDDIVFVANGSGDYRTTSAALCQAVRDEGVPVRIETFVWSHGPGRALADHLDHGRHLDAGRRLAAVVAAARQANPDRAVYLVGHSSGAAVVLAAAEASPPGSVERIALLAPSVSKDYDLRPALRCARQGLDAFISRRDVATLGWGTGLVGTADNRRSAAAGRVGFTPILACPGDDALYTKLRLHPWDPCVEWTGNRGGHFGTIQQTYTRAYLLPLLVRRAAVSASPPR